MKKNYFYEKFYHTGIAMKRRVCYNRRRRTVSSVCSTRCLLIHADGFSLWFRRCEVEREKEWFRKFEVEREREWFRRIEVERKKKCCRLDSCCRRQIVDSVIVKSSCLFCRADTTPAAQMQRTNHTQARRFLLVSITQFTPRREPIL